MDSLKDFKLYYEAEYEEPRNNHDMGITRPVIRYGNYVSRTTR